MLSAVKGQEAADTTPVSSLHSAIPEVSAQAGHLKKKRYLGHSHFKIQNSSFLSGSDESEI